MFSHLHKLVKSERGGTAVEYGLILSLVVLAMFGALATTADKTISMWNYVTVQVVKN